LPRDAWRDAVQKLEGRPGNLWRNSTLSKVEITLENRKYSLQIAGLRRELPIIPISDELSIASFVILGDTELVCATAAALVKKLPPVDYLITAEAKGIPLIQEMSRILGMPRYFVARKSIKAYMERPVIIDCDSITTSGKQILCLDRNDAAAIAGKRVAIVDDVISTGHSLTAVETLVSQAMGEVVAKVAILAEGEAAKREDVIYLEELPLF